MSNNLLASAVSNNVLELTSSSSQPSTNNTDTTDLLQRLLNPRREYGTVQQRLESFKNWPVPFIVRPEQLASAGFYYRQYKDVVECAFCKGALMNWYPNQDPDTIHKSFFPSCDLYKNHEDETIRNVESLLKPEFPEYTMIENRLKTFTHWPKDHTQTPKMLATAGFFYIGDKDRVRCFHCGGGVGNWEPTDDAWVEHARWFAKCGFVKLMRGQTFIKQCIDNKKPLDISYGIKMPVNRTGNFNETPTTSQANNPIIRDRANSKQDVKSSIPSLSTVVQVSSSVTNATNSAKDATESSVASSKCSKLTPKTIFKKLFEDTNMDSDMTETELLLFMTLVEKLKISLKKRLEETDILSADIDRLTPGVLHILKDITFDNSLALKVFKLLKQYLIETKYRK